MAKPDPLTAYKAKRNFSKTPEPAEGGVANESERMFVVQKHWARRLHYDFRLELGGTMKSWAVPKGPSFDSTHKRMAMHVEDHPLSYNTFEGDIPRGHYGAGKVIVWDRGTWHAVGDPHRGYKNGKIVFDLHGHKLHGRWALIRMKGKSEKQDPWLLIKEKDSYARPASEFSVVDELPDSVLTVNTGTPTLKPTHKEHADDPSAGGRAKTSHRKGTTPPLKLAPQLASLAKSLPRDTENWIYELKFDGYRLLTRVHQGCAAAYTRNGHDWSDRLPGLIKQLELMKLPDGWYDGEIVALTDEGLPDFQALQNAFDTADTAGVDYFLFDMPFCDDSDLRTLPLIERRARLKAILESRGVIPGNSAKHATPATTNDATSAGVRFSDAFNVRGQDLLASACKLGLEGIIAKRKDAPYVSHRSDDWLKLKCTLRQEFVIGGYTEPQGSRAGFGSLLLGVYDRAGTLRYAGNVGTGFKSSTLVTVHKRMQALKASSSPFASGCKIGYRNVHWVKPRLVAEISFAGWTQSGHVRQAVFHGLRTDKPARQVTRETAAPTETTMTRASSLRPVPEQQKITNADRVIDASTKTTKGDLVRYTALIAPLMLPHLKGRPVSFLRAPKGLDSTMFFQKHMDVSKMAGLRQLPQHLDPEHEPLMEISQSSGLLSTAQMNVIEFHTWNAVKDLINKPNRMIFDLDPGKGTSWSAVQDAALLLKVFLTELELVPFIKTSGGKGLHVVVPVQRRYSWDDVKDVSEHIVHHLARTFPDRFTSKSGPRNRVGKLFIDYLRNGFGATTVCAWSARARPGMAVSVPLYWNEVESLSSPDRWRIANIHERLDVGNEPWLDYDSSAKTLTAARKKLKALKAQA